MMEYTLDTENALLIVRPASPLAESDFLQLARAVDPYIRDTGDLAGLLIDAPAFPGWDSLGAMVAHFRFVRDHEKHIGKIALVTDSVMGDVAEKLASHFVSAQIQHFPAGQVDAAVQWITNSE
mgnify:CR=1 FL=1